MIARHITSHDENGMRLLGIGREIHRTPTQQALENLAMDLASREGSVIYAQQRCMDGAAISKAYHCEGRVIVDRSGCTRARRWATGCSLRPHPRWAARLRCPRPHPKR